jgi:catalase
MFAYPDASRYRLGVNYQQLPCNKPVVPVYTPYQRDGLMTVNGNFGGDPSYHILRNTTRAGAESSRQHDAWALARAAESLVPGVTDDDFEQARLFWTVLGRQTSQQEHLVENVAAHIKGASPEVWDKSFGMWSSNWVG